MARQVTEQDGAQKDEARRLDEEEQAASEQVAPRRGGHHVGHALRHASGHSFFDVVLFAHRSPRPAHAAHTHAIAPTRIAHEASGCTE